jgi:hypothetical protein
MPSNLFIGTRSSPQMAERLSQEIDKIYLERSPDQQAYILRVINRQYDTKLTNLKSDLVAWLGLQDPRDILTNFRRIRMIIFLSDRVER